MKNKSVLATVSLVIGMLLTGSANTIITKWQDKACVANCDSSKERIEYSQPVWQTFQMFIGEFFCYIVYLWGKYYSAPSQTSSMADGSATDAKSTTGGESSGKKSDKYEGIDADEKEPLIDDSVVEDDPRSLIKKPLKGYRNFLLSLPTICDLIATTLMNVGLLLLAPSIYQMLRGAVVVFTGLFSVIFLKAKLHWSRVSALVIVLVGVCLVGLASVLEQSPKEHNDDLGDGTKTSPLIGVALIVAAQAFSATQFVIEEKIIHSYSATPMKLVGLEGLFGILIVFSFMIIMHYSVGIHNTSPKDNFFNVVVGWEQFVSNPQIWVSALVSAFSIGAFNWFGLNITRYISATSRTTIDTCRTVFIWMFSLAVGWETFKPLQVVGFLVLIWGTFVFNRVIPLLPGMKIYQK